MTMGDSLSDKELKSIIDAMPNSVAVHLPEFDADGRIIDARLRWWNTSYGELHTVNCFVGQSMRDVYFDPEGALDFVRRAWNHGPAHQLFSVDGAVLGRYQMFDEPITLSVDWVRIGGYVVEIGENLTLLTDIQRQLASSDLELLESWRLQQIADEKQRMARDIHDSVMQRLLAVGMGVRLAINTLDLSTTQRNMAEVLGKNLDEAVAELRLMVNALSTDDRPLADHELSVALSDIVDSMSPVLGHRPEHSCAVTCTISTDFRNDIAAVVRESLANIAKHASATRTYVRVECDRGKLSVTVLDNGVGIDPSPTLGRGLTNLRHRAAKYGGEMIVKSRSSRSGTRVTWCVPCQEAPAVDAEA